MIKWAIVIGALAGAWLAILYPPSGRALLLMFAAAAAFGSGFCLGAWAILSAEEAPPDQGLGVPAWPAGASLDAWE